MHITPLIALLWACPAPEDTEVPPEAESCEARDPVEVGSGVFTDVSDASGMRLDNYYPDESQPINDHSRLAFADLNGDGFDDVVMHSLYPNPASGIPFEHLVFLNDGDGTFTDHSDASGLRDLQVGFFAFADVDDDGDQDLFGGLDYDSLDAEYTSGIWLNDGQAVFSRVEASGLEDMNKQTVANAVFADFDGDGHVDLFLGKGGTTYSDRDDVYLGLGDGTFDKKSGRLDGRISQPSNGSTTCDYDDDGDLDIFVSTYGVSVENGVNHLWQNNGSGKFTEVAWEAGWAAQITGNTWTSTTGYGADPEPDVGDTEWMGSNGFGLDCGDVDNDGDLDMLLSTISHPSTSTYSRTWSDPSQLLLNASGVFTDVWAASGLPFNEGDVDAAFVDFDNDGHLDISLSRERKYEGSYDDPEQKGWFGLMHQQTDGSFTSIGLSSGINDTGLAEDFLRMKGAQNHAWSDVDHDGDLDLLVGGRDTGGGRPNFLFLNDIGQDNRWLAVRIVGDADAITTDAFGTRVTLTGDDWLRMREKKSSRGMYNSEDTRVLHFGLGSASCPYTMTVRWPDGTEASFSSDDIGEDRFVTLTYPDQLTLD